MKTPTEWAQAFKVELDAMPRDTDDAHGAMFMVEFVRRIQADALDERRTRLEAAALGAVAGIAHMIPKTEIPPGETRAQMVARVSKAYARAMLDEPVAPEAPAPGTPAPPVMVPCARCRGAGRTSSVPCLACGGVGEISK